VKARTTSVRDAHPAHAEARRVLRGRSGPVDEVTGARVLELYGLRRPKEATVGTPEAAAAAARKLAFPVVIKALAPELPHKARIGGVRVGIANPTDAEVAAAEVLQAARRAGARAPKVLVQEMASGAEVLIGAVIDDRFGPFVTMRPGGALAEAGEAVFVPCPLTPAQAKRYVEEHAAHCGLDPATHALGAVAKALDGVARAASDLRDRLTSLEANPLLVSSRGAVAVDALAEAR
jgi:acetate---CoA ligase (ADP-forming)